MNDEKTDHAHHLLHRHVRVVEEGAVLIKRELVGECATWLNHWLADKRYAVHFWRYLQTMPVHRGRFWQLVLEEYAYTVTFIDFDSWPRNAAVVAPGINLFHRINLGLNNFGRKTEDFDIAFHRPWQLRHVWSLHENIPTTAPLADIRF